MLNKLFFHRIARNLVSKTGGLQSTTSFSSAAATAETTSLTRNDTETRQKSFLKMKGWHIHSYGDIDELQCSEKLKVPQLRKAEDCLVKVLYSSVNPIDVAMLGGYGAKVLNAMRCQSDSIEFPLTFGREFCGIVTQTGMNFSAFESPIGQRVWGVVPIQLTSGSHAEYVVVPQHCLSLAPRNLSDEEAAAVLYAGLTAWSGLYVTGNLGGLCGALTSDGGGCNKRILILGGSGSVGSLAIQMLKAQGGQVVATCSENAMEMVKNLGADCVIDYNNPIEMKNVSSYGPYDIVLDCCGQGPQGAENLNAQYSQYITFSSPLLKNIDKSGMGIGWVQNISSLLETNVKSITRQNGLIKWGFFAPAPQGIELLRQLVDHKKLLPVIEKCYDFEQMPEAYERVKAGHLRGKVVVKMS